MNATDIKLKADRIAAVCAAKGYYNPKIVVYINWLGYDLTINLFYCADAHSSQVDKFFHGSCDAGIEALLLEAERHIANLPSIEDAKRDAFIAAVGRLIDQGKEIGVEVDFLNPLTALMDKLSTNILTKEV